MSSTIIEVAVDAAVKNAVARVVTARLRDRDVCKIVDEAVIAEAVKFTSSEEFRAAVRAALLEAVADMTKGGGR